jgi:hypothetical protein
MPYYWRYNIKEDKMGGNVTGMGQMRKKNFGRKT